MQNTAAFLIFSFLAEWCENQGTTFLFYVIPIGSPRRPGLWYIFSPWEVSGCAGFVVTCNGYCSSQILPFLCWGYSCPRLTYTTGVGFQWWMTSFLKTVFCLRSIWRLSFLFLCHSALDLNGRRTLRLVVIDAIYFFFSNRKSYIWRQLSIELFVHFCLNIMRLK